MPARDEVRDALKDFIVRACKKESLTEDQIRAVEIYLNYFGFSQPRQSRVEQYRERQRQEQRRDLEEVPQPVPGTDSFPHEGLVTGEEAACFLGFGDLKHPAGKIRRLSVEGQIAPPVRKGSKKLRWDAADIRRCKESVSPRKDEKAA